MLSSSTHHLLSSIDIGVVNHQVSSNSLVPTLNRHVQRRLLVLPISHPSTMAMQV